MNDDGGDGEEMEVARWWWGSRDRRRYWCACTGFWQLRVMVVAVVVWLLWW